MSPKGGGRGGGGGGSWLGRMWLPALTLLLYGWAFAVDPRITSYNVCYTKLLRLEFEVAGSRYAFDKAIVKEDAGLDGLTLV